MLVLTGIMSGQCSLWRYACLSVASSMAFTGSVCVTCTKPLLNVRCEIRKSQSIVDLPFGPELLGRACVMAIKSSTGVSGCHIAKDKACPDWSLKSFSLKEAKRAILGETPAVSAVDGQDPNAQSAAAAPPAETTWSALYRPIAKAWQKFLAMVSWR